MIYCSRLLMNPRSKRALADQDNPYNMHRTLCTAFPYTVGALQDARCLFRVDVDEMSGAPYVLVQSLMMPAWQNLAVPDTYLRKPAEVKAIELNLTAGQHLVFRLRANPSVCRENKRRGLCSTESQIQWLVDKGVQHGFGVKMAQITDSGVVEFTTSRGNEVLLNSVLFEGTLCVTEPDKILHGIENGIGRSKGFGFGLLSVGRAPQ